MSFTEDEEILQDFLIEASEIVEQLGEQLVELESKPQDSELLNAVFRGYHTIKGGAGFLNITSLVEICHHAEDVFNVLRQGDRHVDSMLMDVILQSHDVVTGMMESVQQGIDPDPAEPQLLQQLEQFAQATSGDTQNDSGSVETNSTVDVSVENITEKRASDDTSAVVDAAAGDGSDADGEENTPATNDEINDDEFEALLDQLHGEGKHGGMPDQPAAVSSAAPAMSEEQQSEQEAQKAVQGDEITDDEFEALLDQLHGDSVPGQAKQEATPEQVAAPVVKQPAVAVSADKQPSQTPASSPASKSEATPKSASSPKSVASKGTKKEAPQVHAETTVRVDTKRLDDIMNLVGELVLVRNRLTTLETSNENEHLAMAVDNLDLVTTDLQNAVMKTRMQPIKKVFGRFPRVVRDLARSLNKEITLEMMGEETDLDKNLVEALADPLVHLVRNAVDHGIESPDVRISAGKARNGTVVLSAEQEGDHILLMITDDGAGMDADQLRQHAIEKGMMDDEAVKRLTPQECYQLIFMPGFSTKKEISDVSGRGVGMDVVKTRINQLNGTLQIDSALGKGSKIVIKVPLTLAIMPTLMIRVGQHIFALPLGSIAEIFHLNLSKTNVVDGQEVVLIRDEALPLYYLNRWLNTGDHSGEKIKNEGHVVIVNIGSRQVGFVVDSLLGQEEVVIKPLGALLHGTKGIAGATITGDGRISLILDMPSLMQHYSHAM